MLGVKIIVMFLLFALCLTVQAEPAKWQVHFIRFNFHSFNVGYSCDSAEKILKKVLIRLGAREGVRVEMPKCRGGIYSGFQLLLAFSMPVPADMTDAEFLADWKKVRITGVTQKYVSGGNCQLLNAVVKQIFPRILVKPHKRPSCFMRQGVKLNAVAFIPIQDTTSQEG